MPVYVVGAATRRVVIPRQELTLSISGTPAAGALRVRAGADQPVVQPHRHLVVLPRLDGPLGVVVAPPAGGTFAAGTVVTLVLEHDDDTDPDPVQILFDPIDVGGEGAVALATLTPAPGGIEVAAAAIADTPLGPLAAAARAAARKVVGRAAHPRRGALILALDTSASMRPVFADGTAAVAADVVVGVADALGITAVSAVLVGETPIPLPCTEPRRLAEAIGAAAPRWCAGVRWAALAGPSATRTLVCSDFPTTAVRQRFPVLALSADRRLDTDCVRLPRSRPGTPAAEALLAHPVVLERVAAGLVGALA